MFIKFLKSKSKLENVKAYLNFKENVWELSLYDEVTLTVGVPA